MVNSFTPTPFPDVNALVSELFEGVRGILGSQLVGMYLDGSLAYGDFDRDSDIDFIAVTRDELSPETFAALQAMHDRIAALEKIKAWNLGSNTSQLTLRAAVAGLNDTGHIEEEVKRLYAEWKGRGLVFALEPTTLPFGFTFVALDPDGHRIRVIAGGGEAGNPQSAR